MVPTLERTPGKDSVMSKHLNDETAEFALPRRGRHASPDTGELEVTQRMEPAIDRPAPRPSDRDEDEQAR